MGDLVLLYSIASDTRIGKPSCTSPESEGKDGASRVAWRLFSLSGFAELQAQALFQGWKATGDPGTSSQGGRKEQLS